MYILAFSNQFVLIEVNFAFPPAMNISACPPATRHSAPPTTESLSISLFTFHYSKGKSWLLVQIVSHQKYPGRQTKEEWSKTSSYGWGGDFIFEKKKSALLAWSKWLIFFSSESWDLTGSDGRNFYQQHLKNFYQ